MQGTRQWRWHTTTYAALRQGIRPGLSNMLLAPTPPGPETADDKTDITDDI